MIGISVGLYFGAVVKGIKVIKVIENVDANIITEGITFIIKLPGEIDETINVAGIIDENIGFIFPSLLNIPENIDSNICTENVEFIAPELLNSLETVDVNIVTEEVTLTIV